MQFRLNNEHFMKKDLIARVLTSCDEIIPGHRKQYNEYNSALLHQQSKYTIN